MIIAIDGYSSTGKSTFAKLIAARLGLIYLDSGAIYRTVTLFALQSGYITGNVIDNEAMTLPVIYPLCRAKRVTVR